MCEGIGCHLLEMMRPFKESYTEVIRHTQNYQAVVKADAHVSF